MSRARGAAWAWPPWEVWVGVTQRDREAKGSVGSSCRTVVLGAQGQPAPRPRGGRAGVGHREGGGAQPVSAGERGPGTPICIKSFAVKKRSHHLCPWTGTLGQLRQLLPFRLRSSPLGRQGAIVPRGQTLSSLQGRQGSIVPPRQTDGGPASAGGAGAGPPGLGLAGTRTVSRRVLARGAAVLVEGVQAAMTPFFREALP